eukprot:446278_1
MKLKIINGENEEPYCSNAWADFAIKDVFVNSAIQGAIIAISLAFIILLISTQNYIISIFAVLDVITNSAPIGKIIHEYFEPAWIYIIRVGTKISKVAQLDVLFKGGEPLEWFILFGWFTNNDGMDIMDFMFDNNIHI